MKKYNVPVITCVALRTEESIAAQASCKVGSCFKDYDGDGRKDPGEPFVYVSPGLS